MYGIGKKILEIECMKWEFKSNTWMHRIGKFHNWTMDVWNWQEIKDGMYGLDLPLNQYQIAGSTN